VSNSRDVPLPVPIDRGSGPVLVLLPGFGLPPAMYGDTATLLAERSRVVIPELYRLQGAWRYDDVLDRLAATLDELHLDRVTLVGHSFAGGLELGYATRHPERIDELVFVDTLAVASEGPLAEEAMRHPLRLLWLATPRVAGAFVHTAATHPRQLAEAAWFGFTSHRTGDMHRVAELGLRAHVMWANRDSLLSRADGQNFARQMHATFTVVDRGPEEPIDHDWMYRHPRLFVDNLEKLGLDAFRAPQRSR